jgi:hypothetical protein
VQVEVDFTTANPVDSFSLPPATAHGLRLHDHGAVRTR